MKKSLIAPIIVSLLLALAPSAMSQADPCSLEGVLDSFRAAALSGELDAWLQVYERGSCSPRVIAGVRGFVRDAGTIDGTRIMFENAMEFDGQNDYVEIFNPFDNRETFTVTIWVNPSDFDGRYHAILGYDNGNRTRQPSLYLADNGGLHFDSYSTSGQRLAANLAGFFETSGEWIHVAWVKDGSTYRVYRNGEPFGSEQPADTLYDLSTQFFIGRIDNYWDGRLAELSIWNYARTQEEIAATMNTPLRGDEPGLVAYYPLDDVEDGIAEDLVAGNDGIVHR